MLRAILRCRPSGVIVARRCLATFDVVDRVMVPRDQVQITFARSAGPGGQNVNKVNTKVEIRFNVETAKWLSDEAKQRLMNQQGHRITKANELVVTSMVSRSQHRNLEDAMQKLQGYIDEAHKVEKEWIPTEKPVSAKLTRLKDKKLHSMKKAARRKPDPDF
ncbi:Prokaryotic-type class I peptide chain release factors domain-containing protein [Plasmodiophora brassicae]|uniref:Prokaryotic-type class I peptide chain release factors domain-containing protein n=2 Tax=Plasmodiophora brassicae TaxID=37360 RepID=A0A3P3YBQ7_PLABS|nr:unnamed protein product [Plasmodiophora brassicae]